MTSKSLILLLAMMMAGLMAACTDSDDEYVAMDRDWDASDSTYMIDYGAVRASYDSLETSYNALPATDSSIAAQRAAARAKLDAQRQTLEQMEAKRADLRAKREAARKAKDKAAYDAARKEADYNAWKADLDRMRSEQAEMQGMMVIGDKKVGGVDVNLKDGKKPLVRVEPGKEDNKPLIELNKNP
jgi:septal ring factor EnvC (AmiA/AmiB activator)